MTNRLTIQDIIDVLASPQDVQKEDAEKFINELFNVIELGLTADELVKIKDFGTFKLTVIQERESVDVNTQEKILIPSHRRINFVPSQTLKFLVNKPFAHFETTPLNDGIVLENIEQESFSEDRVSDDEDSIEETDNISENIDKSNATNTIGAIYESVVLIDNIQNTSNNNDENDEKIDIQSHNTPKEEFFDIQKETVNIPPINIVIPPFKSKDSKLKSKPTRPFLPWYIATAIFMVLIVLYAYSYYQRKDSPMKQGVEERDIPKSIEVTSPVVKDTLPHETISPIDSVETVRMVSGKTLRLIALDKYGSREFWVYIFLNNKDKIKNPDIVPIGLELVLPSKSEYDMNANNPESVVKAEKMGDEEMKKLW